MKKLIVCLLLVMSICTGAFAATTTVQPPAAVGTYVDFYHDVRLQWKPVPGAAAYKVYVAKGYNVTKGFVLSQTVTQYYVSYYNPYITIYVSTPNISWYTIKVTSIDKYGHESAPHMSTVNVWR